MNWLTDIRKLALLTLITFPPAVWPSVQDLIASFAGLKSKRPETTPWATPFMMLVLLVVGAQLAFYLALFLNRPAVRISARYGTFALVAICSLVVVLLWSVPDFVRFFSGYWSAEDRLWGIGPPILSSAIATVFDRFSALLSLCLLVAIFRASKAPDSPAPVSRFLRIATTLTVVLLGLQVVFTTGRLVLMPIGYAWIRDWAIQAGVAPPTVSRYFQEVVPPVFSTLAAFALPYIVLRSNPKEKRVTVAE